MILHELREKRAFLGGWWERLIQITHTTWIHHKHRTPQQRHGALRMDAVLGTGEVERWERLQYPDPAYISDSDNEVAGGILASTVH